MRPSSATWLFVIVVVVQLACGRPWSGIRDDPDALLYQRALEPKPRIPGQITALRSHASSIPPMRLSAADGSGLALRSLVVRGVIDDPLSSTELHFTFENPHDQVIDGQFEILLPSRAEVSRFALMVAGEWVESEVVERERAREIYQDHKHTRRDPALFERERGRRFRGRVFPIAPRERKQIVLRYAISHDQAGATYRVPLAGLPRVDALDVQVVVRRPGVEDRVLEHHVEQQAPDADFEVALEGPAAVGLAVGDQALVRVVPIPASEGREATRVRGVSVLLDTSASMASRSEASVASLEALISALEQAGLGELPLEIIAFDQGQTRIHAGRVSGVDARVLDQLRARAWLGASDLGAALDAVDPAFDRVICVCDGEATAGATTRFEIAEAIERASARGLERIDAIMLDGEVDEEALARLVEADALAGGTVLEVGRTDPSAWIDELLAPPAGPITLSIAGAREVWPRQVEGLRPGQALLVHASFAKLAPKQVVVELGGDIASRRETIDLRAGDDELAPRAIALLRVGALIEALEAGATATTREQAEREIVELSTRWRILGDHTAMLALDSERAYASYGIARGGMIVADAAAIPAGDARQREFTSVVDLAPTASVDAAGISLAGTTAEQHAVAVVERSRRVRGHAHYHAEVRARRRGQPPAAIRARVEASETKLDEALLRCARHAAAEGVTVEGPFELALGFDAQGQLLRVLASSSFEQRMRDCALLQLHELGGTGWAASEVPDHAITRRYRVAAWPGYADAEPPKGWHLRGVAAFARALEHEPGSGMSGWAKFIEEDLADGLVEEALDVAWTWHHARPDDLLPYVSLGRALAAAGEVDEAARAYGSLIDLHPSRAESRRFAGALLESLDRAPELALAIDSYRKARALQPDHPTGYHALALALARHGSLLEAVEVLVDALGRTYAAGRFGDAVELMRRDLASVSAAAIVADPNLRSRILTALVDTMVLPSAEVRDQFTLTWESDASSLHLIEAGLGSSQGGQPFSARVQTGYGPQGLSWDEALDEPIALSVVAERLGPEALGLGCVRRMRLEADGHLVFETRPFVIWPGQEVAALGSFEKPQPEAD
jgi:tetratricopeptide (TPR) repeat protein